MRRLYGVLFLSNIVNWFVKFHQIEVGFPIAIPLRAIVRKCAQLLSNCVQLRGIARNYAELRAIFRNLQGSQLRASKIYLRWKP